MKRVFVLLLIRFTHAARKFRHDLRLPQGISGLTRMCKQAAIPRETPFPVISAATLACGMLPTVGCSNEWKKLLRSERGCVHTDESINHGTSSDIVRSFAPGKCVSTFTSSLNDIDKMENFSMEID